MGSAVSCWICVWCCGMVNQLFFFMVVWNCCVLIVMRGCWVYFDGYYQYVGWLEIIIIIIIIITETRCWHSSSSLWRSRSSHYRCSASNHTPLRLPPTTHCFPNVLFAEHYHLVISVRFPIFNHRVRYRAICIVVIDTWSHSSFDCKPYFLSFFLSFFLVKSCVCCVWGSIQFARHHCSQYYRWGVDWLIDIGG